MHVSTDKKDYTNIHFMRLIACLAVIVIHITATPVVALETGSWQQLLMIGINRLAKPSVPLFIFISGFLLYKPHQSLSFITFYKQKCPKLILTYMIWAFVYYITYVIKGFYPLSLSFYMSHLIKGDLMYHLYFMVIIIQFYFLFPFIQAFINRFGLTPFYILSLGIQAISVFVALPYGDRLFPAYMVYFGLGIALKSGHLTYPKTIDIAFTCFSYLAYTVMYYLGLSGRYYTSRATAQMLYLLFSVFTILALFKFFKTFKRPDHPLFYNLSKATMEIYYAHPLALLLGAFLYTRLGFYSIIGLSFFQFVLVLILILPLSLVVNHLKNVYKNVKS